MRRRGLEGFYPRRCSICDQSRSSPSVLPQGSTANHAGPSLHSTAHAPWWNGSSHAGSSYSFRIKQHSKAVGMNQHEKNLFHRGASCSKPLLSCSAVVLLQNSTTIVTRCITNHFEGGSHVCQSRTKRKFKSTSLQKKPLF